MSNSSEALAAGRLSGLLQVASDWAEDLAGEIDRLGARLSAPDTTASAATELQSFDALTQALGAKARLLAAMREELSGGEGDLVRAAVESVPFETMRNRLLHAAGGNTRGAKPEPAAASDSGDLDLF